MIVPQDIYRFTANFEGCFKSILEAAGALPSAKVHKQRGRRKLPASRVEIQFQLGGELGHYSQNHLNEWVPDAWNGNIRFVIIADRTKAPDFIADTVSKIREVFAIWKNAFTADNLPWYTVYAFKDAGSTPAIQADKDRDVATMTFSLVFGTRLYWNAEQSYTAQCEAPTVGSAVTVTIPAGTNYDLSKAAANATALAAAQEQAEEQLLCNVTELLVQLPNGAPEGTANVYFTNASSVASTTIQAAGPVNVEIRFRGVAEGKGYTGGSTDGVWQIGGAPQATVSNIYKLEVSSPAATYYLNPGVTWSRDFTRTILVNPGAELTLSALSVDNAQLGNGGATVSNVPAMPITQPYAGQFFHAQILSITPV